MIKNKNNLLKNLDEKKNNLALSLGVMSIASVAGIIEMPAHLLRDSFMMPPAKIAVINSQAPNNLDNQTPLQREKAEVGVEFVSYSESQRTPSRSGRI